MSQHFFRSFIPMLALVNGNCSPVEAEKSRKGLEGEFRCTLSREECEGLRGPADMATFSGAPEDIPAGARTILSCDRFN